MHTHVHAHVRVLIHVTVHALVPEHLVYFDTHLSRILLFQRYLIPLVANEENKGDLLESLLGKVSVRGREARVGERR